MTINKNFVAPALPVPPLEYSQPYSSDLVRTLRLYFNQLDNFNAQVASQINTGLLQFPSGAFQDNTTQTGSTTYPSPISFTQIDFNNQVILDDTTATFTGSRSGSTLTASAVTGSILVGSHITTSGYESAVVTASITNNVMDVTAVTSGTLAVGQYLTDGVNLPAGARIAALLTGTGGVGTYAINIPDGTEQTLASTTITAYGTYITNQLSGTSGGAGTYSTSTSGTVSSRTTNTRHTTKMKVLVAGTYSLTWSGQFSNLNNAAQDINVWIRINGVDVAGSNGVVSIGARKSVGVPTKVISGWNYFVTLNANDYVEFWWLPESSDISLVALPANVSPPYPSTASMIATLGFVSALY